MKNKVLIFFIIILFLIFGSAIFISQYFNNNKIKSIIESQVNNHSNYILKLGNLEYSFNEGLMLYLGNIVVLNKKTKKIILKTDKCLVKLKILPLFEKKFLFDNIEINNGNINISFLNRKTLKSKNNGNNKKSKNKIYFFAKRVNIVNFDILYKNNIFHTAKFSINNFSLNKKFNFKLISNLIVGNKKGSLIADGKINIAANKIDLDIQGDNLNLNFLKIKELSFGNASLNAHIHGNIENNLKSNLTVFVKGIHYNKIKELSFKTLKISSDIFLENKSIQFNNIKISLDKNINILGKGSLKHFKNFNFTLNSKIRIGEIVQYLPLKIVKLEKSGEIYIKKINITGSINDLSASKIYTEIVCCNISGKSKYCSLSDISFKVKLVNNMIMLSNINGKLNNSVIKNITVRYKNNILNANGKIILNIRDLPNLDKKLTLNKGTVTINLKNLSVPVNNLNKIKFLGYYSVEDTVLTYDFFKNINIKKLKGSFDNNIIKVKKAFVVFRNNKYYLNGYVKSFLKKPVKVNFNISSNYFDKFIAKKILKLKIGNCNISGTVNLTGELTDKLRLSLNSGKISFNKSHLNLYNHIFDNISGTAVLSNNIVSIDKINFNYNKGNYSVYGKIISPFKNHKIDLYANANCLDEFITKHINMQRVENVSITAHLTGSFSKVNIESAKLKFIGSKLIYKEYKPKRIFGTIVYDDNVAILKDINLYLNNVKYKINGQIVKPFTDLEFSINAKTASIDKFFLKKINLNIDTVNNLNADFNITGKLINKKLNLTFTNSIVDLKNTDIHFLKDKKSIENLTGRITINNKKISFNNLKGYFSKGILRVNGYFVNDKIKKGYFYITGEHFVVNSSDFIAKNSVGSNKKKKSKNIKKPVFMEKIYHFIKDVDLNFNVKLRDVLTEVNHYQTIDIGMQINKKGIFLNKCLFRSDKNNGFLKVKKGFLTFSDKAANIFNLDAEYKNINIGDIFNFIIPKKDFEFYGNSGYSYAKIHSDFNKFDNFYKNLNGSFNINFKDGLINKAPFVASVFSLLNISQVLEFKLPDMHSKGFNYKYLKGKFTIKNGIVNTKNLKLKGNAFDLVFIGDIDLNKKIFNANIAVYPLKTVDKVIKYIPLIGYLFKDKNGRKKIITTYLEVTGPLDKPSIKILPLKSIGSRIGTMFRNIIELPINIFKQPDDVIIPGSK